MRITVGYTWKGADKESSCACSYKMATMVVLLRNVVDVCNETESMAEELLAGSQNKAS